MLTVKEQAKHTYKSYATLLQKNGTAVDKKNLEKKRSMIKETYERDQRVAEIPFCLKIEIFIPQILSEKNFRIFATVKMVSIGWKG